MLETQQEVLVEGFTKRNNYYIGRANNNKIIYFKSGRNLLGKFVFVKVIFIKNNLLYGELI